MGDLARRIGTVAAETNADIGRLERRTVVHAIADHGDDRAGSLKRPDDLKLLGWAHPTECLRPASRLGDLGRRHGFELSAIDDLDLTAAVEADPLGNRPRRRTLISGQHDGLNTRAMELPHQCVHARPHRIGHAGKTDPGQILDWDIGSR